MRPEVSARKLGPAAILAFAVACGGGDDRGEGQGGADGGAGEARTVEVTTWLGSFQKQPLFAAAQDGDGAWEVLDGPDGVHSFEVTSGRYGFLFYCDEARRYAFFSTVDEGQQVDRGCEGRYSESPTVHVAVEGLMEGEYAWVGLGRNWSGMARPGSPAALFPPPGIHDLVIALAEANGAASAILVERDVEVREGEDLDLTFDAADAVDATAYPVALDGYLHLTDVRVHLATADGSLGLVGLDSFNATTGDDLMYGAYPDADPTDLYRIWIGDSGESGQPAEYRFISDPQDLAITAPDDFTLTEASAAATTPSVRLQTTFAARAGATYSMFFKQTAPPYYSMDVYLSGGWLAGQAGTFTWQQPDFAGLGGWDPAWAFGAGVEVGVSAVEMVGDLDPLIVLPQFPPDRKVPFPADLAGKAVTLAPTTATFVP